MTGGNHVAPRFDAAWRARQRYQPYFCEENVWWLLAGDTVPAPAAAVFVTNERRRVAMWGQRAAITDPIVWDYHAVALLPAIGMIVDLDDRSQVARPVSAWLVHAFRGDDARLAPSFRVVPKAEFLGVFSSDRSHMLDTAGRPVQPLPPWHAPFAAARGMNLPRFLDLADGIAGVVVDAAGLVAWR